jgi:Tautomerase enzyme
LEYLYEIAARFIRNTPNRTSSFKTPDLVSIATKNVVFIGITSRQRTEAQKTTLYRKLVEELNACGVEQNDIVVSIVTNSDADWSFGNGRAQFLTGEL